MQQGSDAITSKSGGGVSTPTPSPSIKLRAFTCPSCGAHSSQQWFRARVDHVGTENAVPYLPTVEEVKAIEANAANQREAKSREPMLRLAQHFRKILDGEFFIGDEKRDVYASAAVENLHISRCFTCHALAVWKHDALLYPPRMTAPPPNPDLSADVLRDYQEARQILDLSPRGAASLLRLAVEKICIEIGAQGKTIDQRIADLVAKGLPKQVEQALDAVRVIGNEAVHPGQLDLRDDRDTAVNLFGLVNFIAEDRISRPKQIAALYEMIPEGKRQAIEERNTKAQGKVGA